MIMARLSTKRQVIGFAVQADLNTENTTASQFRYAPVTFEASHTREQEDFSDIQVGQVGAFASPAPGSRSGGTVTTRFPVASMKSGYNPVVENPGGTEVISPQAILIATALGSGGLAAIAAAQDWLDGKLMSTSVYAAADVGVGSTTSAIKHAVTRIAGDMIIADTSVTAGSPAIGWTKDYASAIAETSTLFADSADAAAVGDHLYGSAVAYLSHNAPAPLTIRASGDNAAFLYKYIGCIAKSMTLDLKAKSTPTCEITWQYADRERASTGGGIVALTDGQRIRPALGDSGGRLLINGALARGYEDLSIEVSWSLDEVTGLDAGQGVHEIVRMVESVQVSATVPIDSSDTIAGGDGPHETAYADGTVISLQIDIGLLPGRIMSVLLPALEHAEAPQRGAVNNLVAEQIVLRPAPYAGDTSTAPLVDPANTLLRVGFA